MIWKLHFIVADFTDCAHCGIELNGTPEVIANATVRLLEVVGDNKDTAPFDLERTPETDGGGNTRLGALLDV
jgi:hypothetical protein